MNFGCFPDNSRIFGSNILQTLASNYLYQLITTRKKNDKVRELILPFNNVKISPVMSLSIKNSAMLVTSPDIFSEDHY